MPPVVAAIALSVSNFAAGAVLTVAGLGAAGTAATVGSAVFEITEGVIYLGLAVGAAALLQPKLPDSRVTVPLKQSLPPRRSGYGEARISGFYMLYEAKGGVSYDVVALHHGRIDGYTRFYLNDDEVKLDGAFKVISPTHDKYKNHLHLYYTVGEATETSFSVFNAEIPEVWSSAARGDGTAALGLRCSQDKPAKQQTTYPNGLPLPGASARLLHIYDPRLNGTLTKGDPSAWSWSDNAILELVDYLTDEDHGMGLSFARRVQPTIDYVIAAANTCDETLQVENAATSLAQAAGAGAHLIVLRSVAGLAIGTEITISPSNSDTEVFTVTGVDTGGGVALSGTLAFEHDGGTQVTWRAAEGGFEKRYRAGGVFEHVTAPTDVVTNLLASCDGWIGTRGDGALIIRAGVYYEPTVIFTDDHVLAYSVKRYTADEEAVNILKISYTDPNQKFNNVAAADWRDQADIEARGQERSQNMNLLWVPSATQARRLAKRQMTRFSAPLRGQVRTNLFGMNALGERYVRLRIAENAALVDLPVEIQGVNIELSTMSLLFDWVQADPDIDAWSTSEEDGVSGPVGARVAVVTLDPPAITVLTPVYDQPTSSDTGARLSVTVDSPLASDVGWVLRWAPAGSGDWTETPATDIADGASVTLTSAYVPANQTLDVQTAYITAGGQSDWSDTESVTTAAPTTVFDGAVDSRIAASASDAITASEGLTAGQIVSIWASSGAKVRVAGVADKTKPADGFVLANVTSGQPATVFKFGQDITGLSGLTPGATYFLAASGGVTSTRPTSGWLQIVGKALSATTLRFQPQSGDYL